MNKAEAFKKHNRVTIELGEEGSKREATLLRPNPEVFTDAGLDPLIFDVSIPLPERNKRYRKSFEDLAEADLTRRMKFQDDCIRACLIDPKIWDGEPEKCPDGMVTIRDLGSDADDIFLKVLEMGGFLDAQTASEAARMFRGETIWETDK